MGRISIVALAAAAALACGDDDGVPPHTHDAAVLPAPAMDAGPRPMDAASSPVLDGSAADSGEPADAADRCDLCADVECPQPQDYCSDLTAISYTGPGYCSPATGECVFAEVERRIRCYVGECHRGACEFELDGGDGIALSQANSWRCATEARRAWEVGDPYPTCTPPAAYCDGEVAVSFDDFDGAWSCRVEGSAPVCQFERRRDENCSAMTNRRCADGRCVECERDAECGEGAFCDHRGMCADTCAAAP